MGVKVRERQKGSGVWWIIVDDARLPKKRLVRKIGSKAKAERMAEKMQEQLRLYTKDFRRLTGKVDRFEDYAKKWMSTIVPATCKESTQGEYELILRKHILPVFQYMEMTAINRQQVKEFLLNKINEGYSIGTVKHMKCVISGIFNIALDAEIIPANPALNLGRIFKKKKEQPIFDPLNREELDLLLETFREDFPAHYPLALTLARTGMRFGEAIALQWGDIDFKGHFINVQRGLSRGKAGTPKSGKSRRVDMSDQLTETLLQLREKRFKPERKGKVLKLDHSQQSEYIFANAAGGFIEPHNWRNRIYHKALEMAGIRRVRIHDIRHSYASILIQEGASLAYVRDQLGHHSISITVDIYGHLVPGANRDIVNRLDSKGKIGEEKRLEFGGV